MSLSNKVLRWKEWYIVRTSHSYRRERVRHDMIGLMRRNIEGL